MHVRIEAHITGESTYITIKRINPGKRQQDISMFVDTIDPEPLVNALETKLEAGLYWAIFQFMSNEGKTIRDPIELRLKLDSEVSASSIPSEAEDPVF